MASGGALSSPLALPASASSPERHALGDVSNGQSSHRSLSRTDSTSKLVDDGPNLNSVRHNLNDNLFSDAADDRNARADEDTEATNRHKYDFTGRAREEGQRYRRSYSRKRIMRKKKLIPRIIMPR